MIELVVTVVLSVISGGLAGGFIGYLWALYAVKEIYDPVLSELAQSRDRWRRKARGAEE